MKTYKMEQQDNKRSDKIWPPAPTPIGAENQSANKTQGTKSTIAHWLLVIFLFLVVAFIVLARQ